MMFDFEFSGNRSARATTPFDEKVREGARTSPFFSESSIEEHMAALKQGPIGAYLADFCEAHGISMKQGDDLPENTEGIYLRPRGIKMKGQILFGRYINALLLGHEIRHAWQHLKLPGHLQNPDSAEGQIFLDRFLEADGRAIEFGVALQTVHAMRPEHAYAYNLIACLDDYEKDICDNSIDGLMRICSSTDEMKMAMRRVFNYWIATSPVQYSYDKMTQETLSQSIGGKLTRKMFSFVSGGHGIMPVYTRASLDPEYPQKLAEAIGFLGDKMGGNYLTDTAGPAFNAAFYTRVCNYRLERSVGRIAERLRAG